MRGPVHPPYDHDYCFGICTGVYTFPAGRRLEMDRRGVQILPGLACNDGCRAWREAPCASGDRRHREQAPAGASASDQLHQLPCGGGIWLRFGIHRDHLKQNGDAAKIRCYGPSHGNCLPGDPCVRRVSGTVLFYGFLGKCADNTGETGKGGEK